MLQVRKSHYFGISAIFFQCYFMIETQVLMTLSDFFFSSFFQESVPGVSVLIGGGGHFRKNYRTKGCLPTMGNPGIITHSCCEHITGGVNIQLYGRVILLVPECAVCLCLCLCDIKSETSKHSNYVSDLSQLDNLLHKMHSNVLPVLRYQRLTCVDP